VIGTTVAHYTITEKLGEGGMGEVYRARDSKLNRDVALKILPQVFAQDAQRMARFERGISKSLSGTEILAESYRC
jgi:serine/threonine protein kinase